MKMSALLVPDLKEMIANLKEDTCITNAKEEGILLLPPTWKRCKSLQ